MGAVTLARAICRATTQARVGPSCPATSSRAPTLARERFQSRLEPGRPSERPRECGLTTPFSKPLAHPREKPWSTEQTGLLPPQAVISLVSIHAMPPPRLVAQVTRRGGLAP